MTPHLFQVMSIRQPLFIKLIHSRMCRRQHATVVCFSPEDHLTSPPPLRQRAWRFAARFAVRFAIRFHLVRSVRWFRLAGIIVNPLPSSRTSARPLQCGGVCEEFHRCAGLAVAKSWPCLLPDGVPTIIISWLAYVHRISCPNALCLLLHCSGESRWNGRAGLNPKATCRQGPAFRANTRKSDVFFLRG
jgi:hypothetical protein